MAALTELAFDFIEMGQINWKICNYVFFDWLEAVLGIYCNAVHCPVGGSTVPLEYEAGCVCEAGAWESHQPCEHGQCEDRPGEHIG